MPRSRFLPQLILTGAAVLLPCTWILAQPPQGGPPARPGQGAPPARPPQGGPPNGPQGGAAPAPPRPEVLDFAAESGKWAWLSEEKDAVTLFTGGPGAPPERVAEGSGWKEVAVDGGTAWLIARKGESGSLLRLRLEAGVAPETVATGLADPHGLFAGGGSVYWVEERRGSQAGLEHLPTVGPVLQLRTLGPEGKARLVTEWPGSPPGPFDGTEQDQVIGAVGGAVFLKVRRVTTTEFVRVSEAGRPTRVAVEPGPQQATLRGETLYWTAPSEEASPNVVLRCVRRALPEGGSERLADWLPSTGNLVTLPTGVVYAADQVYRVPERPGPRESLGQGAWGTIASDGSSLVLLDGPATPRLVQVTKGRS